MVTVIIACICLLIFCYGAMLGVRKLDQPKRSLLSETEVKRLERELGVTVEARLEVAYEENQKWIQETERILNPPSEHQVPSHQMGPLWGGSSPYYKTHYQSPVDFRDRMTDGVAALSQQLGTRYQVLDITYMGTEGNSERKYHAYEATVRHITYAQ